MPLLRRVSRRGARRRLKRRNRATRVEMPVSASVSVGRVQPLGRAQSTPKTIAARNVNATPTATKFRGFMKVIGVASLCFKGAY
jgi:hypothetical protein